MASPKPDGSGHSGPDSGDLRVVEGPESVENMAGLSGFVPHWTHIWIWQPGNFPANS